MRIVQIHGPDDVRLDEAPIPELGPLDVLLKINACGVCGSDLTFAKYGFQRQENQPWPLGHEAAGTVVAIGTDVKGITPGLRAAINPMGNLDNIVGNGGSEGAFAEYLIVRNARIGQHLLPLPDSIDAERAALAEPMAVALHGVNQGQISADDKVVVFGAGPIGLGAIFWLKRRGVKSIVSVDLSDGRLNIARQLGATATINPSSTDFQSALTKIHGSSEPVNGQPTTASDVYIDMAAAGLYWNQSSVQLAFKHVSLSQLFMPSL